MRILPRALAVAAVASIVGCDYFSNVVVPQTDTTPPLVWGGVYDLDAGNYMELNGAGFVYSLHTADITNPYLLVGAGIDSGGVAKVVVKGTVEITCQSLFPLQGFPGANIAINLPDQVVTATGNVGDTVSNGQFTYEPIRFDSYMNQEFQSPLCPTGTQLLAIEVGWNATVTDFHGNVSTGPGFAVQVLTDDSEGWSAKATAK